MKSSTHIGDSPRICAAARRAGRAVTQLYDLVLAPTGLKATQFIILRSIAEHGEIAQCALSREHTISIETLSRRLAAMRNAGWITMRIFGTRRERVYRITTAGEELLSRARPFWERAEARLAEAHVLLNYGDLVDTVRILDGLTAAAQQGAILRTTNGKASSARAGQP